VRGRPCYGLSPTRLFLEWIEEKMAKKKKPKRLFRKRKKIKFFGFSPRNKMIEEPEKAKGGHNDGDQT